MLGFDMQVQTLAVVLFAAIFAVAGCVAPAQSQSEGASGGPAAPPPAAKPEFTEDTGSITGIVTTDEGVPLTGATVGIDKLGVTTVSDSSGAFTLNRVVPGDHAVAAIMLGYESQARRVSVLAGNVVEVNFVLVAKPVELEQPITKQELGNIQCSVRAYPGVPTGGVGGLPPWVTGVAVCGLVSLPGMAPDKFLINYQWPVNPREVLLEMTWQTTQASGRGLSVVLEHTGFPNNLKYTFGNAVGVNPISVYANETKMKEVEGTSGISCAEKKCPVYTRVFAAANTTEFYSPQPIPALGPLGQPPSKIDVGLVLDQKFTQYMTTFHGMTRPADFTRLAQG